MQLSPLFSALQLGSFFNFESACSLSSLSSIPFVDNTTLFQASVVPAGSTIEFPDTDPSCSRNPQIVSSDICRITMQVETSPSSNIHMEAWLPRNWTGRFLSTGNGGLGGCIQYPDLAYTTSLGFATVGANNGHNGSSGAAFENHPEVLADFVFRSIHTNVIIGKQITRQFYGQAHKKSYYFGCSTGGREGLKSVEDFPEDFDGVVAGSAAANFVGLMGWSGHFFSEITGNSSQPTFIPLDLWTGLIHNDILSQCDGIDGVQDGIIEDPNLCEYNPSGLLCQNGATSNCLTPTQIETVRKAFQPFLASDGTVIYPRAQPGAEALLSSSFLTGRPFQFTSDWFRFVVFNSSFDPTTLTLSEYELALKQDPFRISTFKGDLRNFNRRGGKLLTYHGQADGLVSPRMSEVYYDHAHDVSGGLDSFYRFFRISGMSHCRGGPGAWQIGQTNTNGTFLDPDRNVLTALVRWVEQGEAPQMVEGVKYVNDDPVQGVAFQRRHCRYPLRNTYDGQGDPNEAESWSCKAVRG
ncbi:tannase and feruloyl esterase [Marasmius fiardii PR-910]|nr:tannase and feruloyl esterase [Marasmius fiardii PR-910]